MKKKKQSFKRFFAMLLSLVMLMTSVQLQPLNVQAEESTYYKVVDVTKLSAGENIIIVAAEDAYALGTVQNTNNRGQGSVTKSDDGNTVTLGENVQIITLEEGTTEGTFAFQVGEDYLYAASSSSNYLKTQTDKTADASWKIEITDGIASITVIN